jgi:hypothetical protein
MLRNGWYSSDKDGIPYVGGLVECIEFPSRITAYSLAPKFAERRETIWREGAKLSDLRIFARWI